MEYFKDKDNNIFWFNDNQIENGLSEGMVKITESEKDSMISHSPTTEQQILNKKAFLLSTDWIISKILEVQIKGGDIAPLLTKYATVLTEREEARSDINSLELQI